MRALGLFLAAVSLVAQPLTPDQWRADLGALATELPARHINAFAHITKIDFEREVRELDARIPTISGLQIEAEFLRIVASIGDGHTRVWSQGRLAPFHLLPLVVYWFKDGPFVVSAADAYRDLVGGKLDRIGKFTVEEAGRALQSLFAHENESEVRLGLPSFLVNADLLFAAGVTESPDLTHVEVIQGGRRVSMDLHPPAAGEQPKMVKAFTGEEPLHRKNFDLNYWATTIDDGATVYFQYNRCV